MGFNVSGSDQKSSDITDMLAKRGIKVIIGHDAKNVHGADLVVYTAAVRADNPERQEAEKLGIVSIERAVLLGEIMKRYPLSIAVSGTHGKTTTTSMVASIMLKADKNPTIHVGGVLDSIGGNTYIGSGDYFIAEACEYVESFLHFRPHLALILNIDLDHVDYFKDIEHIKSSFGKFIDLVDEDGYIVGCIDDSNTREVLNKELSKNSSRKIITYGLNSHDAYFTANDLTYNEYGYPSFTLVKNKEEIAKIELCVPGVHNVNNALGAIAACDAFGCNIDAIKEGLLSFRGADRRFDRKGNKNGVVVIDDYAHHPSEIKATLNAAKKSNASCVWAVFQPHTYTRTKALLDGFSKAFDDADKIIVCDIYAAREKDLGEIHSRDLVKKLKENGKDAVFMASFSDACDYLNNNTKSGDMVLTMGAGDIYKVGEMFLGK
jgi:UDP-N-acetylmuramate--alanine ligase